MEKKRDNGDILYIYDRVCTKSSKKREILREYGDGLKYAKQNRVKHKADGEWQPFVGKYGNYSHSYRPPDYKKTRADGGKTESGRRGKSPPQRGSGQGTRTDSGRGYYSYGGTVARERPIKIILDEIVSFFESLEEKGRNDERIAKQRAIAMKKLSEWKHNIITAFVILLISSVFVAVVYNVFFVISDITAEPNESYSADAIISSAEIELGDTLYSFRSEEAANMITFKLPYIKSAEIERTLPNKVTLTTESDSPMFYADIWGDRVLLSAGLRVLGKADGESLDGLIELSLPKIKYSVSGRVVEFSDAKDERYIRNVLASLLESEYLRVGDINSVDLRDEYNIKMTASGKYLLSFGDESDFAHKLRLVYKTTTSEEFKNSSSASARIDLSRTNEASVVFDYQIKLD